MSRERGFGSVQVLVPRTLRKALNRFEQEVAKRVDAQAYYFAQRIADKAKLTAPRKTGLLRSKIFALRAKKTGDGASIFIPGVRYFWPVHQGHAAPGNRGGIRIVAAKPFLARVIDPQRDKAPAQFAKVISQAVNETNRKG